jgi:hypothetical protein
MEFESFKLSEIRVACRHFLPETRGDQGIAKYGKKEELIELLRQKGVMAVEVQEFLSGAKTAVAAEENAAAAVVPIAGVTPAAPKFQKPASAGELNDLELLLEILRRNFKGGCDMAEVENLINAKLAELKSELVRVIEVKQPGDLPNKAVGACHKLTEQIASVANCGIHQMLVGPAGSGKTTCVEKVSEILGLEFYPMSVGPQTTKSDLLGFIDAGGNYHTTVLREAFEKGGVLLLDELDAANAGVLTVINSLLANGYCSFSDGVIRKHDNFRCVCACNTYGRGADRMYVGRNQLDAATLDRFAVVDFDYDEEMERAIAGNDDWVRKVQRYRHRAFDLKMRVVISPRASIYGAKLLASGMDETLVEELVIWKGIASEIRTKISGKAAKNEEDMPF